MDDGGRIGHSSSVRWFALAAVLLSTAGVAGAQALSWLSRSGRVSLVAYHPAEPAGRRAAETAAGVDTTPTGSIPSSALMIRLR